MIFRYPRTSGLIDFRLLALIQPTDLTRLERFFAALVLVPSTMGSSSIAFLAPGECSACNGGWWLCGAVRETVFDTARVCLGDTVDRLVESCDG